MIRVPLHQTGKATGEYEDFLTGFVLPNGQVWGRPVGVTVDTDGSLLVSDDGSNSIWRVSYVGREIRPSKRTRFALFCLALKCFKVAFNTGFLRLRAFQQRGNQWQTEVGHCDRSREQKSARSVPFPRRKLSVLKHLGYFGVFWVHF